MEKTNAKQDEKNDGEFELEAEAAFRNVVTNKNRLNNYDDDDEFADAFNETANAAPPEHKQSEIFESIDRPNKLKQDANSCSPKNSEMKNDEGVNNKDLSRPSPEQRFRKKL